MNGLIDKVPAWLRHGILLFVGGFAATVGSAVYAAGGVTHLGWSVLPDALDSGAVSVAGVLILAGTKLTTQYGRGKPQLTPAATSGTP